MNKQIAAALVLVCVLGLVTLPSFSATHVCIAFPSSIQPTIHAARAVSVRVATFGIGLESSEAAPDKPNLGQSGKVVGTGVALADSTEMYLVNLAAELAGQLPDPAAIDQEDRDQIARIYSAASEFAAYIRERELNERVAGIFDQIMLWAQAYSARDATLQNIAGIVQQMKERGEFAAGYDGGFDGTTAALALSEGGATPEGALLGGLVVGGFSFARRSLEEDKAAMQYRSQSESAAAAAFDADSTRCYQKARLQARIYAEEAGVDVAATGWFDPPADPVENASSDAIADRLDRLARLRPAFPDLKLQADALRYSNQRSPSRETLIRRAVEVRQLVDRIPRLSLLDYRRSYWSRVSLNYALQAVESSHVADPMTGWGEGSKAVFPEFSDIVSETLGPAAADSRDPLELYRSYSALAYASRWPEAIAVARRAIQQFPKNSRFKFDAARLASLNGDVVASLAYLRLAAEGGYLDPLAIMQSKDLDAARRAYPEEFARLAELIRVPQVPLAGIGCRDALLKGDLGVAIGLLMSLDGFEFNLFSSEFQAKPVRPLAERVREVEEKMAAAPEAVFPIPPVDPEQIRKESPQIKEQIAESFAEARKVLREEGWPHLMKELAAPGVVDALPPSLRGPIRELSLERVEAVLSDLEEVVGRRLEEFLANGSKIGSLYALNREFRPIVLEMYASIRKRTGIDVEQLLRNISVRYISYSNEIFGAQLMYVEPGFAVSGGPVDWFQFMPSSPSGDVGFYTAPRPPDAIE